MAAPKKRSKRKLVRRRHVVPRRAGRDPTPGARSSPHAVVQLAPSARVHEFSILACSDLRTQRIEDLIGYIKRHNLRPHVIIYAGDDIERFRPTPDRNLFEELAALSRFGLVAVIGNDDDPEARRHVTGNKVYDVHRTTVRIGDIAIIGQEGAPINSDCGAIGNTLYTEQQVARHLRAAASGLNRDDTVIVVSHAPPHNVLDFSIRFGFGHIGSRALATFMKNDQRVRLVVCGHSHRNGAKVQTVRDADVVNIASHDGVDDALRLAHYRLRPGVPEGSPGWAQFSVVTPYDELSLIESIYRSHCTAFGAAGIRTIAQLAETSPEEIGALIRWTPKATARYRHLARARLTGTPVPIEALIGPPAPRAIFDLETDPYGGFEFCWCIGLLDETTGRFHQWVARRLADERRNLMEFLEWCRSTRVGRLVAYSGSDCDRQRLIARLRAHELPIPSVLEQSVDVYTAVRRAIALPLSSYALKPVAESLGFRFRHAYLDGWLVGIQGMGAVREGRRVPKELLEYNEDDVRSVSHVLSAVERTCGYGGETRSKAAKWSTTVAKDTLGRVRSGIRSKRGYEAMAPRPAASASAHSPVVTTTSGALDDSAHRSTGS